MTDKIDNHANAQAIQQKDVEFLPKKNGRPSDRERKLREKLARIKSEEGADNGRLKLPVKPVDGLKLRWVRDEDNRVDTFLKKGWFFMSADRTKPLNEDTAKEVDKRAFIVLGTKKDGSPLHGYLLGIEEEIFDYYYRRKQIENDTIMQDIERALPKALGGENNDSATLKTADFSVTTN